VKASCLYEGWVRHRRYGDVRHSLRMRLFLAMLDLDELPEVFDGYGTLASADGRRALAQFRRGDYLGDPRRGLADEARALVAARTGAPAPAGPIRLLTGLRQVGIGFNPVAFYYCHAPVSDGARVEAVVAEVTNTPWGERHAYVLAPDPSRPPASIMRGGFAKEFHVSPFMGMDHTYAWRMTEPGERLIVHIESSRASQLAFDATLSLVRRPLKPRSLARLLARHPLQPVASLARIYANGLAVWAKGSGYFPNPSGAPLFGRARRAHARASREGVTRR